MALVDQTSTHPVEWEDEAVPDGLPPPGSGHASSTGTPTAIKASVMSTGGSFAAASGGSPEGPGSAQPFGRAPSLRQAASFLRSSFSASTRFLGRMGSTNDPASRSAGGGAGLPQGGGKGPRESFIGSLLNAVGLGGGGGHGRASGLAGSVSPSGGSRSGPSVTGRSKLMSSPSRALARLSSAAMMRTEIQNFSQFGDLRNDSFSQASTARLRRRSSLTGGGAAGAAEEALAAADAAAAGGGGGAAGLFRKLGSISLLRQSAPAPLSYSPSVRASGSGMVHAGEHAGNAGTPRDKNGDSRHGSPAPTARLARPSEGYSHPPHQPPRYSHSGGPGGLGGDISLASAGSSGRFHSPAHMRPHAPSQLSRTAAAGASPPTSRPGTRGGHDGSGGVSPPSGASGAGHGYVAEAGAGGAPPPGALSCNGSLALRERPPTPKGRSPRSSVNGSPGRLGKVLGSFRLPDILTGGGSGRSVTERRNSVSGGTGTGVLAGNSFTRPSGPIDTSTSGASGPAAAAVAAARQHRLSSGGAGAAVRGSGGSVTGGGVSAMGPGGAAICAAAAKRAAALAAASGGSNTPTGTGTGSAGPGGGGSGGSGTPLAVAASGVSLTGGAPRASGASLSGKAPGMLGGILKDFQTSMELDEEGAMAAVEAEFDRRFGNGGRATPAPHSERTSPTQPMPGSRPQSGRHTHHHSFSALPAGSQSPHPPALPPVPATGAALAGPDRGTPSQQPFVRRRSTLGDGGRPASPMQLRSAAPAIDGHGGGGAGGGTGLESILSTSFDAFGDGGGLLARRPGSASQQSPGSPPQGLNARMRLASIRMSFADGIVAAAPPGPGEGGAGVIRGGPAPTVVPGLVASPSVSQGGVPPLQLGVGAHGQLPQQASPLVPTARPPSSGGGGTSARGRSTSGVSMGGAGVPAHFN